LYYPHGHICERPAASEVHNTGRLWWAAR
jgi:hypothetical protein